MEPKRLACALAFAAALPVIAASFEQQAGSKRILSTERSLYSTGREGHEPPALAGFEIERFRPQLACVEAKPGNRERIRKYFAEHGYEQLDRYLSYDKTNYYFAPRSPAK